MSIFKSWLQTNQHRFEAVQAHIVRELFESLTHIFFYGEKYDAEPFLYEDDSLRPVLSKGGHQQADYERVGDFLEAPTGEQYPTYVSGYGMACETLEDKADDMFRNAFYNLLQELAASCPERSRDPEWRRDDMGEWPDWLQDEIALEHLEWTEKSLEQVKAVSFSWMLKTHQQAAEQKEVERLRAKQKAHQRWEEENAVAQSVARQAHFLLRKAQYTQPDYAELEEALVQLAQVISERELSIYLHSSFFRSKVSLRVLDRAKARFLKPAE